jgi:hypothetical protein
MTGRYVFDCETNGLLQQLDRLHCLGLKDLDSGKYHSFADQKGHRPIREGVEMLNSAELLVGHNIIGFDIKALRKVYPWFAPKAQLRDTLLIAKLFWPHIKDTDWARAAKGQLPKKYIGRHSLAAWGYRIGVLKTEYDGGWDAWTPTMHSYMGDDVTATSALLERIEARANKLGLPLYDANPKPGADCIELEHRVAEIVEKVIEHGFAFDKAKATKLFAKIATRKAALEADLARVFPPKTVESIFVPKKNNKKVGYVKGVPFTKRKVVPFKPSSRRHVSERLIKLGWQPEAYGKDGYPTVDDDILRALPYPQAGVLAEFFLVDKRLGMIANGKEAWLKHETNGRIRSQIDSLGAHTGRMTHKKINQAQVPGLIDKKTGKPAPYGAECRECFKADDGYVLVGCDADALELRDLAGYMARFDGGAYIETVLRGDKSKGTDMHTINAKALGCSRDVAKIYFYAMIYGSGDKNLAVILGFKGTDKFLRKKGAESKAKLMKAVPALGKLLKAVAKKKVEVERVIKGKKEKLKVIRMRGLDGRPLESRSENAALNTLLQSAGAIQMKRGLVILYDDLIAKGWTFGKEFSIVALVHDEWQTNVLPHLVEEYGETACEAIRKAGRYYSFRCPLEAQYSSGANWKETH